MGTSSIQIREQSLIQKLILKAPDPLWSISEINKSLFLIPPTVILRGAEGGVAESILSQEPILRKGRTNANDG